MARKEPASKIAKTLKRTEGATRQKATALGVSLNTARKKPRQEGRGQEASPKKALRRRRRRRGGWPGAAGRSNQKRMMMMRDRHAVGGRYALRMAFCEHRLDFVAGEPARVLEFLTVDDECRATSPRRGIQSSAMRGTARAARRRSARRRRRCAPPRGFRAGPPPRSSRRARRNRRAPNTCPSGKRACRPSRQRSPSTASMMTTGSVRGKCCALQTSHSRRQPAAVMRRRRAAFARKNRGGRASRRSPWPRRASRSSRARRGPAARSSAGRSSSRSSRPGTTSSRRSRKPSLLSARCSTASSGNSAANTGAPEGQARAESRASPRRAPRAPRSGKNASRGSPSVRIGMSGDQQRARIGSRAQRREERGVVATVRGAVERIAVKTGSRSCGPAVLKKASSIRHPSARPPRPALAKRGEAGFNRRRIRRAFFPSEQASWR